MKIIRFRKIIYENFKNCIDQEVFELGDNGLFLIVGPNGIGKSTTFDAIAACLFRRINTKDGNLRLSDLVNDNVGKDLYLELHLDVEENDKTIEYKIITTYNHKYEKDRIYINGMEKIFTNVNEQVKYIEQNVISFDVFYNIVLFTQQSSDTFLSKTDAQQKQVLNTILDFSYFDELRKKVNERLQIKQKDVENSNLFIIQKKSQIEQLQQLLEKQLDEISSKIIQLERKRIELQNEYNSKQKEFDENKIQKLEKELKDLENEKNSIISKYDLLISNKNLEIKNIELQLEKIVSEFNVEYNNLKSSIELEKEKIRSKYREIFNEFKESKDKEKDKLNRELQEIQSNYLSDLQEIEKQFQEDLDNLNSKLNNLEKVRNDKKENILNEYENKLNLLKDKQNKINSTIFSINQQIAKLDDILNMSSNKCPLCLQEINESHILNIQKEKDSLISEKDKLLKELDNVTNKIDDLEKEKENELIRIEKEMDESKHKFQNQVSTLKEDYGKKKKHLKKKYDSRIKDINQSLLNIKQELDSYYNSVIEQLNQETTRIQKEIDDKIKKLTSSFNLKKNELDNKIKLIQETISKFDQEKEKELGVIVDIIQAKQIEYENLKSIKSQLVELQNEILNINNLIETNKQNINKLQKDINEKIKNINNEIKEKYSSIKNIQEEISILEFWLDALSSKGIKSYLISSISPFINNELQELMTKVFGNKFDVKLDIQETSSGDLKIKPIVVNKLSGSQGYKKQSGGEKRLVDYCMIMALNKLYNNISNIKTNILLLDEFFDALDEDNTNMILQVLKMLSKDQAIYIISHNESWKNNPVFDYVYYKA